MAQPDVEEVALRTGVTADMANVVLDTGEAGYDLTTGELKFGDGTTAFSLLPSRTPARTQLTLVAGTKTQADTRVRASSIILPVLHTLGTVTAPKALACTARVNGTSYTITSSDNTDTSVVDVLIWY